MKAMVLAAGFGTRLRPLTHFLPKPAIPFCGTPMIGHTLRWLAGQGVEHTVINVHHLPDAMVRVARAVCPPAMRLEISYEEETALGTAGAVAHAASLLGDTDPLLVVNGDVLADVDVHSALARQHGEHPAATLLLTDAEHAREFRGVALDASDSVLGFWGPEYPGEVGRQAYTGIHWLSSALRQRLPQGRSACMKTDGWVPALSRGESVAGVTCSGTWFDLGSPARYLFAHRLVGPELHRWTDWPERRPGVFSAGPLPDALRTTGPCTLGPNLKVLGPARLGPHCHLSGDVTIMSDTDASDVVAWPGSTVGGRVRGAIAGPFGTVFSELRM